MSLLLTLTFLLVTAWRWPQGNHGENAKEWLRLWLWLPWAFESHPAYLWTSCIKRKIKLIKPVFQVFITLDCSLLMTQYPMLGTFSLFLLPLWTSTFYISPFPKWSLSNLESFSLIWSCSLGTPWIRMLEDGEKAEGVRCLGRRRSPSRWSWGQRPRAPCPGAWVKPIWLPLTHLLTSYNCPSEVSRR